METWNLFGNASSQPAMKELKTVDNAALLEEIKRAAKDAAWFYSNKGKEAREKWVVAAFLHRICLSFEESELNSPPQESKVDVQFRLANFQVKEITDPNIRRGEEVKLIYKKVMAARTLEETLCPSFVYDVPASSSGYQLVRQQANGDKYYGHRGYLDLLCYVTRTRTSKISIRDVSLSELMALGWRSISCLIGNQATVLYAAEDAPIFLKELAIKVD